MEYPYVGTWEILSILSLFGSRYFAIGSGVLYGIPGDHSTHMPHKLENLHTSIANQLSYARHTTMTHTHTHTLETRWERDGEFPQCSPRGQKPDSYARARAHTHTHIADALGTGWGVPTVLTAWAKARYLIQDMCPPTLKSSTSHRPLIVCAPAHHPCT